ncbi:MAG: ferrous iron transport protein A [Candidatus Syntrophoarchaeum sp. WYZ-LMO15]|nr:MAG: ferrous iron transport protein A [Candidatus Syntrophoarchaeum sp. WYZ-LMO15]
MPGRGGRIFGKRGINELGDESGDTDEPVDGKSIKSAIPLGLLSEGEEGIIIAHRCGRGLRRRLLELGFTPSSRVRVVSSFPGLIVDIKGSRIALGRGVAMKIIVSLNSGGGKDDN